MSVITRQSLLLAGILLIALPGTAAPAAERWYSPDQVAAGNRLFQQHCAACHGVNAEGTADWKKTDANGNYPPPPLNGSAHAWHHSIAQLGRSIKQGGKEFGGVMPGFGAILEDHEVLELIAFFQSKWPEDLYQRWHAHYMQ